MGAQPLFTIGGAIKEGWRLTKEHFWFLIGYQIILYVIILLFSGPHPSYLRGILFWLAEWVLVVLVKMGLYNSSLLIAEGLKPDFDQLYQNWRMFLSWIVAGFLFGIMFTIGLFLLIVPGCYVWAKYGFFPFFILDKQIGPIEALKQSGEATKGYRWPIFLLFLACVGLDILGFLLFGIGLLITTPITLIALATVYRKIAYRHQVTIEIPPSDIHKQQSS